MYLSPWIRPQPHKLSEIPKPEQLAFMADAPGQYASTVPSQLGYSVIARHGGWANVVFVDGRAQAFSSGYLGCGVGEPQRPDIRWQTLTDGINQSPVP
jgi:prepilin-type processing-associated H-X9-DG protein